MSFELDPPKALVDEMARIEGEPSGNGAWVHTPELEAYENYTCQCEGDVREAYVPIGPVLGGRYLAGGCPICGNTYWRQSLVGEVFRANA
jgi:hypothetical protein